jgi:maltooligosyltrehalose trehalohydrolase
MEDVERLGTEPLNLGATYLGGKRASFRVWAPLVSQVSLKVLKADAARQLEMERDERGFFSIVLDEIEPGANYLYVLDRERDRPDPASRFQPTGVHGPSELVDGNAFEWHDAEWKGPSLTEAIFYELHVGTFTQEGTFEAIIAKLPYLKELGITILEIMPVAQFPGKRNWGYDGVNLFAVQNSYGGPEQLKELVDACHESHMAVCLDVVYNHFGPEGNYLHEFGPYFTNKYQTPWGDAINYDGAECEEVREFFIQNALYWITEYHIDILRLDAVHGIFDSSETHILKLLKVCAEKRARLLGRRVLLIAESDLNDPKLIRKPADGGFGLDGQWSDDFHHSVHVGLTGENKGYYQDYTSLADIGKAIKSGYVYDGQFSQFRKKKHGAKAGDIPSKRFVICTQNHDQVGNRAFGDRLSALISFEAQKCAAALLLIAPNTPLLFMGQEYGEVAPFQYFIHHSDERLVNATREGRKTEFASFGWTDVPDPQDEATFERSKLDWQLHDQKRHAAIHRLYMDLIKLRRTCLERCLTSGDVRVTVNPGERWLALEYPALGSSAGIGLVISLSKKPNEILLPFRKESWLQPLLDTEHDRYGGTKKCASKEWSNTILLQPEHSVVGKILLDRQRDPNYGPKIDPKIE